LKAQFLPYKDENPTEHTPFVTYLLIIACSVVFIITLINPELILSWGFTPAEFSAITLITSIFLHGGILHIFGNMLFLYIYGDNVEDKFGHLRYLIFYLAAGAVAGLVHYTSVYFQIAYMGAPIDIASIPAVGASGAISGVLGAYFVMFPKVKIRTIGPFYMLFRIRASVLIGIWFALQLILGGISLFGFAEGIGFFAHIGGFLFGYIAGKLYCHWHPRTEPRPIKGLKKAEHVGVCEKVFS